MCTYIQGWCMTQMVYSNTGSNKRARCCHNILLHSVTVGHLRVSMIKMSWLYTPYMTGKIYQHRISTRRISTQDMIKTKRSSLLCFLIILKKYNRKNIQYLTPVYTCSSPRLLGKSWQHYYDFINLLFQNEFHYQTSEYIWNVCYFWGS